MSRSKVNRRVTAGVRAASCVFLRLLCVRCDFEWFPWFPLIQLLYWTMAPVVRVIFGHLIGRWLASTAPCYFAPAYETTGYVTMPTSGWLGRLNGSSVRIGCVMCSYRGQQW